MMEAHSLVTILLCLSLCLVASASRLELGERALSISDVPTCGIQCLLITVPSSGCSFEDIGCQCSNDGLKRDLGACMLANCTMVDTLNTAKVQADLCDLSDESKTREVVLYTSIVFTIAMVFFALRIAGKILTKRFSWDDWVLVLAMALACISCGCVFSMTYQGFGQHLWNLQPGQLKRTLRLFLISSSTYTLVLGLIKASLVFFYMRIFSSQRFMITAYVVLGYIITSTLAIFIATILSCIPVPAFWDRDIKGKCLDVNALAYANSGNAIASDVILLILPLLSIRRLNMQRYRKIAVGLMFSIGTFGAITTILRLQTLLEFKISIDPTWDYVPVTIWTELELASGFICVSLPGVRILLNMIFPQRFLSFFASIASRSSRNRDPPTHMQDLERQQGGERKGFGRPHIPMNSDQSRNGGWSFASSPFGRSANRTWNDGSFRLESVTNNLDEEDRPPIPPPKDDKWVRLGSKRQTVGKEAQRREYYMKA